MNSVIDFVAEGLSTSREKATRLVFFLVGWLTAWAVVFTGIAVFW